MRLNAVCVLLFAFASAGCGSSSATLPVAVDRASAVVQYLYFDPQRLSDEERYRRGKNPAYLTDVGNRNPVIKHLPPNAAGEVVSTIALRGKFLQRWTTITLRPAGTEKTRVIIDTQKRESFLGLNETTCAHDWSYQQARLAEIRKAVADPHLDPGL